MGEFVVVDTNALLDGIELNENYTYVILSHVLRELDKHKSSTNYDLAYRSRQATRWIKENREVIKYDLRDYNFTANNIFDNSYVDNKILQACIDNKYAILTNDLNLEEKALGFGLKVIENNTYENEYTGWVKVNLSDEEIANFYQSLLTNTFNLETNQYLYIENECGEFVDVLKWDGETYASIEHKTVQSNMFGKLKPYDNYQKMAIDTILTNQLSMIKGKAGSGKSLITLNVAWSLIERGKYEKLYIVTNPVVAGRSASKIGFLPGSKEEKLLSSNLGSILIGKFGDISEVEHLIKTGKIVLLPSADLRGVDIQNSIVWAVEAQNMDVELNKILIQRISDTSKLILDGDYNQVDDKIFEGRNNGMRRVSEVFRGQEMYGEVELPIVYRSLIADIADQM